MSASTPRGAPSALDPRAHDLDKRVDPHPRRPDAPTEPPLIRKPLNPNHPEFLSSRAAIAQRELMQVDAYLELLRERAPSDEVSRHISEALCERHIVTVKLHRLLMAHAREQAESGRFFFFCQQFLATRRLIRREQLFTESPVVASWVAS